MKKIAILCLIQGALAIAPVRAYAEPLPHGGAPNTTTAERPVEESHVGAKVLGAVFGAALAVVIGPVLMVGQLVSIPFVLAKGALKSSDLANSETVDLPDLKNIIKVKFEQEGKKTPLEWGLKISEGNCTFTGLLTPYSPEESDNKIEGYPIILNERTCTDIEGKESIALAGYRSEAMVLFNKEAMQTGYKVSFEPIASDAQPVWLAQAVERIQVAHNADDSAKELARNIKEATTK